MPPPPLKPLAQIHLCVNGRPAVFTPNINITLRVPKVMNSTVPVVDNASNIEEGLAHSAAAGMLEEYEDNQHLLEGGSNGIEEDEEDELTSEEINMIYKAERLALQQDELDSDSEVEDSVVEDTSSDDEDMADGNFIPEMRLKGKDG